MCQTVIGFSRIFLRQIRSLALDCCMCLKDCCDLYFVNEKLLVDYCKSRFIVTPIVQCSCVIQLYTIPFSVIENTCRANRRLLVSGLCWWSLINSNSLLSLLGDAVTTGHRYKVIQEHCINNYRKKFLCNVWPLSGTVSLHLLLILVLFPDSDAP